MKPEINKIIRFPIFWLLIAASLVFNIFLVCQYSFDGKLIRIVNNYVQTGVISEDDEYDYCKMHKEYKENAYDKFYNNLDLIERRDNNISHFVIKPDEASMKIIDRNTQKALERVEEIKADGEAYDETYVGECFSLHTIMYQSLMLVMLIEIIAIAILTTGYLMKYEEAFSTSQLLYITKRGKELTKSKCIGAALISGASALAIEVVTYSAFFIRMPQLLSFLKSSVSSAMASEVRGMFVGTYPFITWIKMSRLQYLICAILLSVLIAVFFSILTSTVAYMSKNAYISVLFSGLLCLTMFAVPIMINTASPLNFVLNFNPMTVVRCSFEWFMESANNPMISYQGFEIMVITVYSALFITLTYFLHKRFVKSDVY